MNIPQAIHSAREAASLSQANLAELVGVTVRSVARWESGEAVPSLDALQRIADALALDLYVELRPRANEDQRARYLAMFATTEAVGALLLARALHRVRVGREINISGGEDRAAVRVIVADLRARFGESVAREDAQKLMEEA